MPVIGGAKLDAYLKTLAERIGTGKGVEVGFLEDATYPDGTSVAMVAAVNEFGGTVRVPEYETTITRQVNRSGDFAKGGRFVKAGKGNFETTHVVPAHTVTIPARPFMRATIQANKGAWGATMAKLLKAQKYNADAALDQMGEVIEGQIVESILSFSDPPNAASTIATKGSDSPLRDTMQMTRSVSHRVIGEAE